MSTKTERQRKKLFRKRIWPKICSALGIIFINLIMIFVIFMCLLFYGVGLQIATNEKQTPEIKARYENLLLESTDAGDAFSKLMTEQRDRDMILFNRERKSVASRGKISINREIMMENDIFSRYPIYMDRVTQNHFESTDFLRGLFKMITKTAFAPTSQKKNIYSGDFEEDYHFDYWVEIPVKDGYLCVKNSLLVLDFSVNMAGFVISAVIFLQLLVLIIFCGSILSDVVIQHRLTKLYYLETLTGGKNWLYFVNYGNRLLRRKKGNCYAVVDFELVKFRNFCSVYGTGKGDELLEKTDAFLRKGLKKKEICARYSLSDFALVFSCRDEQEAMGKVYAMMGGLIGFMEKKRMICHAGLYLTKSREGMKKSEIDIAQMFSKAGSAKSSAEQNPESTAIVFNEDMLKQQTWEQHVEDTMEAALQKEEFQVYLQPKYHPITEKMEGAEALVRWVTLSDGMLSPGRFIPVFEKNGFIIKLDDYMISHVAKQQAAWLAEGKEIVPVSVNVSRAHFAQIDLAEHIKALVDAYQTPHRYIEIELTESAFFDDKELLLNTVHKLKEMEFAVSMDDFGAGYSSLNSLKDLPLDVLKLDADFFRGDKENKRAEIVITEAIQLAKSLNMQIVAEGIEKKEQVDFLARQGCDMIQGYYFAKPMPISEFEKAAFPNMNRILSK